MNNKLHVNVLSIISALILLVVIAAISLINAYFLILPPILYFSGFLPETWVWQLYGSVFAWILIMIFFIFFSFALVNYKE